MSRGASAARQRAQPRRRWRSTARVGAGGSREVPKAFSWKMVGCMMGVEGSSPLPCQPSVQASIREGRPERCRRGGQEPPSGCGYPIRCRPQASGRPRVPEGPFLAESDVTAAVATTEATAAGALIAPLTPPLTPELAAGLDGVEWLEVRADVLGDLDPEPLRRLFPGKLLYTLRSRAEGGFFEGSAERRKRRLLEAAGRYDRVDLEAARDLSPELLTAVPRELRLISWHGPASDVEALEACFARMAAAEAALYKLVPWAVQPGEALAALMLLHQLQRTDVLACAGGDAGTWTRLVAPRLGAPVVFGAAGDAPGAPGQPSIRTLCEDFGLPDLPPVATLLGVAGNRG